MLQPTRHDVSGGNGIGRFDRVVCVCVVDRDARVQNAIAKYKRNIWHIECVFSLGRVGYDAVGLSNATRRVKERGG